MVFGRRNKAAAASPSALNPWLPWCEPSEGAPVPDSGGVLAVIPTAGTDAERLKRCLGSLRLAAGNRKVRPVVVVCPLTNGKPILNALRAVDGCGEVLPLPSGFSYPRSVNTGIRLRRPDEGYVLLLNDDAFFTGEGDLDRLIGTMREWRWGCIGPWFRGSDTAHLEAGRLDGPRRMVEPVVGACALWDAAWLERVGPFDEAFGLGYGHDESDQTLRTRRLGMVWGRNERVIVEHEPHTSFGAEAVRTETEFYQRNLRTWREKWGPHVGNWGGGAEWEPLPGVQVVVAGHNVAPWLERCLKSVEAALDGFRWVLIYADDASSDGSADIASAHVSGADRFCRVRWRDKAATAGKAKNRALSIAVELRERYPAICLMDADDIMSPDRVRHLLWQAVDGGHLCVHGAFRYVGGPNDGKGIGPNAEQQRGAWLSPCSTIFHGSLLPGDGRLFCEDLPAWEDAELFLRWWLDGVRSVPCPGAVVHEYHVREGSVMMAPGYEERRAVWLARQAELLAGRG